MTRHFAWHLLAALLTVAATPASAEESAKREEAVRFESFTLSPSPFEKRLAEQQGRALQPRPGIALSGVFETPVDEPPFAAIVLLHGCEPDSAWIRNWRQRLSSWGYAVLTFDAIAPRGGAALCREPYAIHPSRRARDLHGALKFLAAREDVDPNRIGAVGLTHGAWSLLYALTPNPESRDRLSAAISIYPLCGPFSEFSAPLWLLSGERRRPSSSYDCDRVTLNVPNPFETIIRVYPELEHPIELFEIKDDAPGNLAQPQSSFEEETLLEIEQFLAKHLERRPKSGNRFSDQSARPRKEVERRIDSDHRTDALE